METQVKSEVRLKAYSLEVSLEYLHSQSIEWLEDIKWIRDELAFWVLFLEKNKAMAEKTKNMQNNLIQLRKEIIGLESESIHPLIDSITRHEKELNSLLGLEKMDEKSFRLMHQDLALKNRQLLEQMKNLKRRLFDFYKGLS